MWKVDWVDGHKHPSIGTRKPDSVHYAHREGDGDGAVRSVYNIAYIGDLKSQKESGSGDMADDEIAHMLDFLGTLARVQTWRRNFVGYLLDGEYIVFLSATFDPSPLPGEAPLMVRKSFSGYKMYSPAKLDSPSHHLRLQTSVLQSDPLPLRGDGGLFLRGLMLADLGTTRCDLPRVTLAPSATPALAPRPVKLNSILGVGSTSVVFRALIDGGVCAVKCVRGDGGMAHHEKRILKHLRSFGVTGIAGLAFEAVELTAIITSPVGEALAISADGVRAALSICRLGCPNFAGVPSLITGQIFDSVVDTLVQAHACGVIHGDPRLSNLAVCIADAPMVGVTGVADPAVRPLAGLTAGLLLDWLRPLGTQRFCCRRRWRICLVELCL